MLLFCLQSSNIPKTVFLWNNEIFENSVDIATQYLERKSGSFCVLKQKLITFEISAK